MKKPKPPDILERLKHARWVLRVQVQLDVKGIGSCVATLDSPHGTKDSLRGVYKQAKQMVTDGQAVYAAAHDYWAKTYGADSPLVLSEIGDSTWAT
jgi:hypothetical protein